MPHRYDCHHDSLLCPARENLLADIAKLRAALEQISRYHDCWVHSYHPAEYARRILEQQRESGGADATPTVATLPR